MKQYKVWFLKLKKKSKEKSPETTLWNKAPTRMVLSLFDGGHLRLGMWTTLKGSLFLQRNNFEQTWILISKSLSDGDSSWVRDGHCCLLPFLVPEPIWFRPTQPCTWCSTLLVLMCFNSVMFSRPCFPDILHLLQLLYSFHIFCRVPWDLRVGIWWRHST